MHKRCLRSHPPPPSPTPAAGARPGAREAGLGGAGSVPWAGAGLASVLGLLGLLPVNSFSSLQSSSFTSFINDLEVVYSSVRLGMQVFPMPAIEMCGLVTHWGNIYI